MRTSSVRRGRSAARALAVTAALAAGATATAQAASSHRLPTAGKLTMCHTTLFKVGGRLPVHTAFATQKHKHPSKALVSCRNANAVAKAGKRFYHTSPFGVGKKVHVGGVTYTMGVAVTLDGLPTSGPIYGWSGGGVVIYLMNPTG